MMVTLEGGNKLEPSFSGYSNEKENSQMNDMNIKILSSNMTIKKGGSKMLHELCAEFKSHAQSKQGHNHHS
jgi:hypothetical protein